MSDQVLEKPDLKKGKTRAGNYFVSNYPPFSFWNEDDIPQVDAVLDLPAPDDTLLGLYYHVPFCRKRCHFCYFRVYTDKNAKQISAYLDATIEELKQYADRSFLKGRKPKFIYFGGGTPSYLSPKQLSGLTDRMKELISWDEVEEVTFEAEPGTLNQKKLDAIRKMGVTRLSLGIENFQDRILEINGRAHRSGEVYRAYEYAREIGFPQINVDLIAGMLEETEDNWKRNVEEVLKLSPDCVTIYQMEVPYNTGIYKTMKEEGKLEAPVADWPTKRRWVDYAFKELEKEGYTINSGTTAVKDASKTKFLYRDMLWKGADLLALGVASFGHLGGTHYQNITHIDEYVKTVEEGRRPINRALFTDAEERVIREFILQMKLGRVDFDYFRRKFEVDLPTRFETQFRNLAEEGLITVDEDCVQLPRATLLMADSLLHDFFLPKHQNARYT